VTSPRTTGLAVADPQAYRANLFTLVGDRDPLEILEETASVLGDTVRTHPAAVLRTRPPDARWTPNEIIGHLADGEWVAGYRVRLILCEDEPAILGMNQDLWVTGLRHDEREPSQLVDEFRTLRQFNLAVWRRMAPADLQRTGRHNERGPESLAVMLRMMAGHDLSHLNQIARYIEAVQARRST
jgi:hypothetical protein